MADYINTENTIGFYKFNNSNDVFKNSVNSSINLNWQGSMTGRVEGSNDNLLSFTNKAAEVTNIEKLKYKSRSSSIRIPESKCIYAYLPYQINSITTEFWFYPKSLGQTANPSSGVSLTMPNPSPSISALTNLSNPFLFNYGITFLDTDNIRNTATWKICKQSGNYINGIYDNPIFVQFGYCVYNKKFVCMVFYSSRQIIATSSNGTSITTNHNINYTSKINCPPNRWYHVAIVQNKNVVHPYINGQNMGSITINTPYIHRMNNRSITQNYSFRSGTMVGMIDSTNYQSSVFHISIGNRALPSVGPYKYKYNNTTLGNGYTSINPGFQDVIIDDLRITNGALYDGTPFVPPGMSGGYQLAYVNNNVYGYDDTYEFVKIASNWDSKTPIEKQSIINTMGLMDIVIEDIQSITTSPTDEIHMEIYAKDSNKKVCNLIEKEYETTVIPSSLLSIPNPLSELKKISFTSSLTEDSYIKILITSDLTTYKTYDFVNNVWIDNVNITDISVSGMDINKLSDISATDLAILGNDFAFAYFLHLEPYEANCNISKLDLDVSLTYAQKHCNQTIANYEYPMFNKLKVIFYEDGEFKVNYMDKP